MEKIKKRNSIDINLSERETEILKLIISERTTAEIADELYLSIETIKTYRKNLLEKLNACNMAGLVRRAFEYSIVPLKLAN